MNLPRPLVLSYARNNAAKIREIMRESDVTVADVGKPELYDKVAPHLGFSAPRDVFDQVVKVLAEEGLLVG